MDDETLKRKYRHLASSLNEINRNINDLIREIESLRVILSDDFIVDNKYYKKEELEEVLTSVKEVKKVIKEKLIPSARRKGN